MVYIFLLTFCTDGIFNNNIHETGQLMSKEHRTHAASERANDLWCYQCDTMEDGEKCSNLSGNYSAFEYKCMDDKRVCMVR